MGIGVAVGVGVGRGLAVGVAVGAGVGVGAAPPDHRRMCMYPVTATDVCCADTGAESVQRPVALYVEETR
ncbi:MAG: hypothetical protein M3R53_04375, partial [Candidatus Eremiobacteraeota bacterium]|nr:hypothetical protein [Candidatus Eremiobacteraeota bacterium]